MRIAGIDPDTRAIQIVVLGAVVPSIHRIEATGRRAEDRIQSLAALLEAKASVFVWHEVRWVYVETPVMGVNAKALRDQAQVVGIVRSFLWRSGLDNSLVDNGTWKKGLLGNGHASKEEIAAYALAFLQMPTGQPQDAYDAACIAAWGRNNIPQEVSNG